MKGKDKIALSNHLTSMATALIETHASHIKGTNRFNKKNDAFLEISL